MEKFVVSGGNSLFGEVTVSGAKNAAVAIIPAAVLVDGICIIENIPKIQDVLVIIEILREIGAECEFINNDTLKIDSSCINKTHAPYELARKMRASYYLVGALISRFHKADIAMPGGCNFGSRPMDLHVKGLEALGADVTLDTINQSIIANCDELVGSNIYFDIVSVGSTINIMLAAVLAKGTTVMENVAKEPHVVDLANFLNAMGADVKGAGTDTIRIKGVERLHGGSYSIIPDQIEAGTFMIAAAAVGGEVLIKNLIPKHMESVSAKLSETGVEVIENDDSIKIISNKRPRSVNVKTMPYPGFPTDMQPQMVAFLSVANGSSTVIEGVWDFRFQYVEELQRMGANIRTAGKEAFINGVDKLHAANVKATDLRGGAGVVIAALMANGTSEIYDIYRIDRGYEKIEDKLSSLGADIKRVIY